MNVSHVLRREVVAVTASASFKELISLFYRHRVDSLPVVDKESHVVGLITLEDLIHIFMPKYHEIVKDFAFLDDYGVLEPVFLSQSQLIDEDRLVLVADILNRAPILVRENASLLEAAALMESSRVKRLCVVNKKDRLIGMISYVDIVLSLLAGKPISKGF